MSSVNNTLMCNICNKKYKSINSLGNHNRNFHPKNKPNINHDKPIYQPLSAKISAKNDSNIIYKCKYCNKEYKHIQSRWKHERKCKIEYNNEKEILKKENTKLKKELNEIKQQMMELMKKTCKMHPKTLMKINNQLNNCNITNINIVQLGKEDIVNTLSQKEKIGILNNCYQSIDKLIEYVHFNPKYPQFKNIAITNLKDEYAYRYDEIENKFIACKKEELLDDLFDNRTIDLEEILDENTELITNVKASKIKTLLEKLYDKQTLYDKKKSDIKLMIYNKSEKDIIKNIVE